MQPAQAAQTVTWYVLQVVVRQEQVAQLMVVRKQRPRQAADRIVAKVPENTLTRRS